MHADTYDVVIVGGGPGGATAAWEAARTDDAADVLALEAGVPREDRSESGPDSTDAAGLLDYWRDMAGLNDDLMDGLIEREIEAARFVAGDTTLEFEETGEPSAYDNVAYTFDRVGLDDRLRARALEAGAEYRTGARVTDVTSERVSGGYVHTVTTATGETIDASALVLADGPKRQVTVEALSQFHPREQLTETILSPAGNNHVAYQEYRRVPEDVFVEVGDALVFWWDALPGETAYTWAFPNRERVVRFGLTMPMATDLPPTADGYRLLDSGDETLPAKSTFIRRLLGSEFGDTYDVEAAFPRVGDRGKRDGTEAYAISSMRPIDSPVHADIAVVGGAMGSTSAFHEGGYHTAVATGRLAGTLAAQGDLARYNRAWKETVGREIAINVVFAEMLGEYGPAEWEATLASGFGGLELETSSARELLGLAREYASNPTLRGNVNDLLAVLAREFGGNALRSALPGLASAGRYDCVKLRASEYSAMPRGAEAGG